MVILITIVHIIVSLFLVIVVLLQSGKAADLAGAFGGMGSQTVFGPRGSATALSRATAVAAAVFMITSLSLAILAVRGGVAAPSLLDKAQKPAAGAPAAGAPAPGKSDGKTVKATIQTETGGVKSEPRQVEIPVQGQPPAQQAPAQPAGKKK